MKRAERFISRTDISTRKKFQHLRRLKSQEKSSREISNRMGQNSIKSSKKIVTKNKRKSQKVSKRQRQRKNRLRMLSRKLKKERRRKQLRSRRRRLAIPLSKQARCERSNR